MSILLFNSENYSKDLVILSRNPWGSWDLAYMPSKLNGIISLIGLALGLFISAQI